MVTVLLNPRPYGSPGPGASPPIADVWLQRVGALASLPALIRSLGADPAAVLADAGLSEEVLADASNRIAFSAAARLLTRAAARTGCPHLGLLLGRSWHLPDHGLLGEVARHAPTLGEALQELVLFQHANSGGAVVYILPHREVTDFGYAIYDPQARDTFQMYDTATATIMNAIRELCGNDVNPSEVFLPHDEPVDAMPYRRHFRASLRFNAEFCALRFPRSLMARPVEGADPVRLRAAQDELLRGGRLDLVQAVYRTLRTLMLLGRTSGSDVAAALAMHRRTLNRRLSAAGTTFQRVLDDVRFAVAKELLESSSVSMHDIAAALGYAGLAPFMRAFRRWSGKSPGDWRKTARTTRADD